MGRGGRERERERGMRDLFLSSVLNGKNAKYAFERGNAYVLQRVHKL